MLSVLTLACLIFIPNFSLSIVDIARYSTASRTLADRGSRDGPYVFVSERECASRASGLTSHAESTPSRAKIEGLVPGPKRRGVCAAKTCSVSLASFLVSRAIIHIFLRALPLRARLQLRTSCARKKYMYASRETTSFSGHFLKRPGIYTVCACALFPCKSVHYR